MNRDPLDPQDSLEQRLQALQPRSLPAAWRREILGAALPPRRRFFLQSWLPGRWPGAALGAAWAIIALLRITTPAEPPSAGPGISLAEFAAAQEEKRLLLASLNLEFSKSGTVDPQTWHRLENRPL